MAAASVILALGLRDGIRLCRPSDRIPPCSDVLAPLQAAPIPAGATAALLVPKQWRRLRLREPLGEATFRRPDVNWRLANRATDPQEAQYLVVIDPDLPLANWRPIWRRAELTVLTSDR